MSRIIIAIDIPAGVQVSVRQVETGAPVPDDFEKEPLPPFQGTEENFDDLQAPSPAEAVQPFRTVATQPQQVVSAPMWQEGMKHREDHRPLKAGRYGLYCPTAIGKGNDGKAIYCQWRAA